MCVDLSTAQFLVSVMVGLAFCSVIFLLLCKAFF